MSDTRYELLWNRETSPTRELFYDKDFKEFVSHNKKIFSALTRSIKEFLKVNSFYELTSWDLERAEDGTLRERKLDLSMFDDLSLDIEIINTGSANVTFKFKVADYDPLVIKILKDDAPDSRDANLKNNEPIQQGVSFLVAEEILSDFTKYRILLPRVLAAFKDQKGGFLISKYEEIDTSVYWRESPGLRQVLIDLILHIAEGLGYQGSSDDVPVDPEEQDIWIEDLLAAYLPDSSEIYMTTETGEFVWLDFVFKSVQHYLSNSNRRLEEIKQKYLS